MSKLLKKAQDAIEKSGLSQAQIALKAGVTQSRVSELKNRSELRGTEVLEKILEAIAPDEFYKFVGEKLDNPSRRIK